MVTEEDLRRPAHAAPWANKREGIWRYLVVLHRGQLVAYYGVRSKAQGDAIATQWCQNNDAWPDPTHYQVRLYATIGGFTAARRRYR